MVCGCFVSVSNAQFFGELLKAMFFIFPCLVFNEDPHEREVYNPFLQNPPVSIKDYPRVSEFFPMAECILWDRLITCMDLTQFCAWSGYVDSEANFSSGQVP